MKERRSQQDVGGLTWFDDIPTLSAADMAAWMINTIDEHHGPFSQTPGFVRLTVIGATDASALRSSLTDIGFRVVSDLDSVVECEKG
jgi:hypothetical protein